MPAGKGLRGVLDNIVSDGMRVAAEVRKQWDEAQREVERNALGGGGEAEEEEEEEDGKVVGGCGGDADADVDAETRSVRDVDRDLLEAAEVGGVREEGGLVALEEGVGAGVGVGLAGRESSGVGKVEKVVEFESSVGGRLGRD